MGGKKNSLNFGRRNAEICRGCQNFMTADEYATHENLCMEAHSAAFGERTATTRARLQRRHAARPASPAEPAQSAAPAEPAAPAAE